MTTVKNSTTIFAIIGILFLGCFAACKKTDVPSPAAVIPKNNIAFIYKSDSTDAAALKALLEENDCHVTLIDQPNAAAANYADYKLIIIDNNTDGLTSTAWTSANTTAINASGKPMLLIGVGGLQFAGKIDNKVKFAATAQFSENSFLPADKTADLYHVPTTVSIPTSTPKVVLYTAPVMGAGALVPVGTTIAGVNLLGHFSTATQYYPVTNESNRFTMFGFYGPVSTMTSNGKNFIVNLCFYAGSLDL